MGALAVVLYKQDAQVFAAMHLLGLAGEPEEIARVALFLCSQDASFITGQAVVVDGGYSTGHRMIRIT